ncbi:MAG: T9SS type A sorting domain-containing protein [Sphingomonadales bacterium]|jgi:fibronectin-binding autotransporter adhesin
MKKSIRKIALWLIVAGSTFSQSAEAQIYNVGVDDGFSFACAGSTGNELFLPVTLYRFETHCVNDGIRVTWTLQDEYDNGTFILEKSLDGKQFFALNNAIFNRYTQFEYLDREKTGRVHYYRLKQQRAGASPEYSTVVSSECQYAKPVVSPNPTTGTITVQSEEPTGTIIIKDLTGKCVHTCPIDRSTQQIDAGHLNSGIYSLELHTAFNSSSQRIIIAR